MNPVVLPARFVLRSDSGEILHEYTMDRPQLTIGRASNRDISLPHDKLISRRHLLVSYENGSYVLIDEGSANGTYVNGHFLDAMQPYILHEGDKISIGRHQLEFHLSARSAPPIDQLSTVEKQVAPPPSPPALIPQFPATASNPANAAMPAPDVSMIARFQATAPMHAVSAERLRFTVFYPPKVVADDWRTLLIYVYPQRAAEDIQRDFVRFLDNGNTPLPQSSTNDDQLLLRGTNITVIPECPGAAFNPKRFSFVWLKDWHRVELRFSVRKEWETSEVAGRISVFAGPLLLGMLPLELHTEQSGRQVEGHHTQVTTSAYQQIFAYYSQDDTAVMMACRNVYRALGFNELARIDALRAGSIADDALRRLIEESAVFQLFWSANAAKSPYVMHECQYALQLKRKADEIRPVYWDIPMIKPPEVLSTCSFTYLPRYTFIPRRP
jgi:pSer/pThr/pTyr-binding forkhead associated (FHA) protein